VNRFLDPDVAPKDLVRDCYQQASAYPYFRHSEIATPENIFASESGARKNAQGVDLDDAAATDKLLHAIKEVEHRTLVGHSIVGGEPVFTNPEPSLNPSNNIKPAGTFHCIDQRNLELAIQQAHQASPRWAKRGAQHRANHLSAMADLLEAHTDELVGLINREAGRTIHDCVSEVREAVDFCRYYGAQARLHQDKPAQGVFFCISPWNFPLAIFTGQVSAALAAGNCVLAKPADATPIIATRVTQLFHQAGVPHDVLQLIIGDGPAIGASLLPDPRLSGVAFTGSTEVAQTINQQLAQRTGPIIPFIAETGGQNCMVVDSTALPEQVVDDVISSAFHSAGQRCSALRVLYLQDVIADGVITMLKGALSLVKVGSPQALETEVGPIIDQAALERLQEHADYMAPLAKSSLQAKLEADTEKGTFFAPRVYEIDSISQLKREVFGPVLHIIRYNMRDLANVIREINNTGYGLTFGVHSRINAVADTLFNSTHAGNTYVNRTTIGAIVGVNPFGGRGLSGTGPKAGGPNYILRFLTPALCGETIKTDRVIDALNHQKTQIMPGPTGEQNELYRTPLGDVLLILNEQTPLKELVYLSNITLALGNTITFVSRNIANQAQFEALKQDIPVQFHAQIRFNEENLLARVSNPQHQAVLIHASHPELAQFKRKVAHRPGPIIPLIAFDESVLFAQNTDWYVSYLSNERTKTDNLVAKGGNTDLFNLGHD